MSGIKQLRSELDRYNGVARMIPLFIPRVAPPAGRRLKVHPDDIYAFGFDRGQICERWFVSTGAPVAGKPGVRDESTMSRFYLAESGDTVTFPEAIAILGKDLLGQKCIDEFGTYKMFSKFYDYASSLPHHLHPTAEFAERVGTTQKPESYYFPAELNMVTHDHDYTFFGFVPGTTKEEVLDCIRDFKRRDNQILTLSQAYKVKVGTGWFLPAGIVHAPASLVTYEPQYMSDASIYYQNVVEQKYPMSWETDMSMIPKDFSGDVCEYLLEMIDWDANIDPDFRKKYFHAPIYAGGSDEEGYTEKWISYGSDDFSAKELRVAPGRTVTIRDDASYGFIMMQGYGTINGMQIDTPSIIRVGQPTGDEGFVTFDAALNGVTITNTAPFSELVMMKHFNGDSAAANIAFANLQKK